MKEKILKVFKLKLIPFLLSISSFSGIALFLFIWKKIDIPHVEVPNAYFSRINTDLVCIKYLVYLACVLLLSYFSIYLAKKCLGSDNPDEQDTIEVAEIRPVEWSFLPVYIWLFVIALSFTEKSLSVETFFLMGLLFLFWLTLDSVSYFNPFLLFLGYRFYEIKSQKKTTFTLITKRVDLKGLNQLTWLIRINNFTFLER